MLSFLKSKQTVKNQYKQENIQKMSDVQDKTKQYQWIKGDNFGNIVTVSSVDSEFTNFTNGSRIFNRVIGEFLQEVIDGRVPLPGADKLSNLVNATAVSQTSQPIQETSIPSIANSVPESDITVVGKMIQKMSKKNVVNVPIQINLNIPTPTLYDMLAEGMEEEDLNSEIMSVALHQIEFNKLQEYIKENVTTFMQQYYK